MFPTIKVFIILEEALPNRPIACINSKLMLGNYNLHESITCLGITALEESRYSKAYLLMAEIKFPFERKVKVIISKTSYYETWIGSVKFRNIVIVVEVKSVTFQLKFLARLSWQILC